MHPAFAASRPRAGRSDLVRHRGKLAAGARAARRAARAFRRGGGLRAQAGRNLCCCRRADGALAGVLFGLEAADRPTTTASCRAACPACCRPAPIASPMRRTTRGSRRSPSRSAPTASRATARRDDQRRDARAARRRRWRRPLAHRRRRDARARPDQHAGQRHGPGGTGRGRARARREARRERSRRSSATICLKQNFPLIHAVGRASSRAPRLIDLRWGDPNASEGHAGRQGRVLRHRRARHQARQRACCS